MADLAFIFDKDKRHSDIQIVAGDFLLCDKEIVNVEYNGDVVVAPDEVIASGTGTSLDNTLPYINQVNSRPSYGFIYVDLYFNGSLWTAEIYNPVTFLTETWTNISQDELPPKTGWSIGSLGSPSPLINYFSIESTINTTKYKVSSLQVAVELSLFTDRRATTAEIQQFQSGIQERQTRRGFWGNSFKEYTQGSGLWLLEREKKTNETLSRAKVFCNDSLQWLVDDGVIESVSTVTSLEGDALIIAVSITKPDGQPAGFKYQFTWDSLEAIQ